MKGSIDEQKDSRKVQNKDEQDGQMKDSQASWEKESKGKQRLVDEKNEWIKITLIKEGNKGRKIRKDKSEE